MGERGLQGSLLSLDHLAAPDRVGQLHLKGPVFLLEGVTPQEVETLQAGAEFGGRMVEKLQSDPDILQGRLAETVDQRGCFAGAGVERRHQLAGQVGRFEIFHIELGDAQALDDLIDFRVIAEGHRGHSGRRREDQGMQPHA